MKRSLEQARIDQGVKQLAVAKHLGITRQTYAYYEKHQDELSINQAKAICDFLHLDFNQIFFAEKVS